jgi:acetyl esterase/lipase
MTRSGMMACAALLAFALANASAFAQDAVGMKVSGFSLPLSPYLSEKSQHILAQRGNTPPLPPPTAIALRRARVDADEAVMFAKARALYPVTIEAGVMGGVPVRTVTPAAGVAAHNQRRVLINLFGGGFFNGAKYSGLLESAPIASLGGYRVVTVSYRLAPEAHFPAARDDVIAVYNDLLKTYRAEDIGIYGCSSGGSLAGQVVARLIAVGIPTPKAIGILCSGLLGVGGDSAIIAPALTGRTTPNIGPSSGPIALAEKDDPNYFRGVRPGDPTAWPGYDPDTLKRFPPTFLMAAGRGFELSQTIQTHNLLTNAGVHTELNIWEGFAHGFYNDPEFPESRDVHLRLLRFFDAQFATSNQR